MARKPIQKTLQNARLLKDYASWVYCDACGSTVAYLCYVTYDFIDFSFTCSCGSHGRVTIAFPHDAPKPSDQSLQVIKNRLCCPTDAAPLLTVVEKNVQSHGFFVVCNACHTAFVGSR